MQYTVAAAAKAAGISPWRLRTWERRYGIPHPGRSATGRRLYSEDDLLVVKRLASLVDQGIPASQAVEAVRAEVGLGPLPGSVEEPPDPRLEPLLDAARALDEPAAVALIREAAGEGWGEALDGLVMPALRAVGELWERGDALVMQEHFFSQLVRRELMYAIASATPAAPDAPLVLLACAEDEQHEAGMLAVWLLLREQGVRVIALGADVPATEVVAAARACDPAVVCLCGVIAPSAPMLAAAARALVDARIPARVFVSGPAVASPSADGIPATILPQRLSEAVDRMVAELER
jgi:MerR family transcriptional regulator, light-induced transcriptional regulator